jgi:hypothetical protein
MARRDGGAWRRWRLRPLAHAPAGALAHLLAAALPRTTLAPGVASGMARRDGGAWRRWRLRPLVLAAALPRTTLAPGVASRMARRDGGVHG